MTHGERELIFIYANASEKRELLEMLNQNSRIRYERFEPKSVNAPLIVGIISGFIAALGIVLKWYEIKRNKQVKVEIKRRDGSRIRVTSKNVEELKVLVEEPHD